MYSNHEFRRLMLLNLCLGALTFPGAAQKAAAPANAISRDDRARAHTMLEAVYAAGRDTVLAQAVGLAGGKADPRVLQRAFPYPWPPYEPPH